MRRAVAGAVALTAAASAPVFEGAAQAQVNSQEVPLSGHSLWYAAVFVENNLDSPITLVSAEEWNGPDIVEGHSQAGYVIKGTKTVESDGSVEGRWAGHAEFTAKDGSTMTLVTQAALTSPPVWFWSGNSCSVTWTVKCEALGGVGPDNAGTYVISSK